ncbi:hypothetical protein [Acidisoma sp.]|uniref:hypothetical protein n=1 Tax=Acidisoma sp. TaxID=1872115 RepID=UPI003B00F6C0
MQLLIAPAQPFRNAIEHWIITTMQSVFRSIDCFCDRACGKAKMPMVMLRRPRWL